MRALLDQFLDYVSLERGLSKNTRAAYADDIARFLDFLAKKGVKSLNDVTRKLILDHLLSEKARGLTANSLSRHLVSLKVFFRYLTQEGLLAVNVAETMESPRVWKMLPSVLTPKEIDRLFSVPDIEKPLGLRNRAILELFYATGLRVSEMAGLQLTDLHFDEKFLRCIGKGRKERVVPVAAAAIKWVEAYIKEVRPQLHERPFGISSKNARAMPESPRKSILTRCVTPLPATCWPMEHRSASFRKCSAMLTSPPPRFTPMLTPIA